MMGQYMDDWVEDKVLFSIVSGSSCACCGISSFTNSMQSLMSQCTDLETDDQRQAANDSIWPTEIREEIWKGRVALRQQIKNKHAKYSKYFKSHPGASNATSPSSASANANENYPISPSSNSSPSAASAAAASTAASASSSTSTASSTSSATSSSASSSSSSASSSSSSSSSSFPSSFSSSSSSSSSSSLSSLFRSFYLSLPLSTKLDLFEFSTSEIHSILSSYSLGKDYHLLMTTIAEQISKFYFTRYNRELEGNTESEREWMECLEVDEDGIWSVRETFFQVQQKSSEQQEKEEQKGKKVKEGDQMNENHISDLSLNSNVNPISPTSVRSSGFESADLDGLYRRAFEMCSSRSVLPKRVKLKSSHGNDDGDEEGGGGGDADEGDGRNEKAKILAGGQKQIQSFRSDRRLLRLLIFREGLDRLIQKFEEHQKLQNGKENASFNVEK